MPSLDPQFLRGMPQVGLDRMLGDREPLSDLPVTELQRSQAEDILLARLIAARG